MLVALTIEANEESFVVVLQHGGNDVACKQSIPLAIFPYISFSELNILTFCREFRKAECFHN